MNSPTPAGPAAPPTASQAPRPTRRGSVLRAQGVVVRDPHRVLLPATTLAIGRGEVLAAVGDPGPGHSALALALGGRLVPDEGTVTLGGDGSARALQAAVALVDVPAVSEPDGEVPIGVVVGEELALAGLPAGRTAVAAALAQADDPDAPPMDPRNRTDSVPAASRVRLLMQLAARRPGVQLLVLALPERWGLLPRDWEPTALSLAADGIGVLVTTGLAAVPHLTVPAVAIGPADQPASETDTTLEGESA